MVGVQPGLQIKFKNKFTPFFPAPLFLPFVVFVFFEKCYQSPGCRGIKICFFCEINFRTFVCVKNVLEYPKQIFKLKKQNG